MYTVHLGYPLYTKYLYSICKYTHCTLCMPTVHLGYPLHTKYTHCTPCTRTELHVYLSTTVLNEHALYSMYRCGSRGGGGQGCLAPPPIFWKRLDLDLYPPLRKFRYRLLWWLQKKNPGIHFYSGFREKKTQGPPTRGGGCNSKS